MQILNMADLREAFRVVCDFFNISDLNDDQKLAITKVVVEKNDLFVNLPTGFGKSLIFQSLPIVYDVLTKEPGHIVLVLSPLLTLIDDQMQSLKALGLSCVSLSHVQAEDEYKDVEKGAFQVVYGTPEAVLKNKRWREMLHNKAYKSKLCAIAVDEAHVIKQWGTSHTTKLAPFRECYGRLHELRSLAPPVNIVAVTATATKETRNEIINILQMKNPFEIYESPEKPNITYVVEAITPGTSLSKCFGWLADELKQQGVNTDRTIIYCQTINQCTRIYNTMKALLGNHFFIGDFGDLRNVTVEMLHSCSPQANKDAVLKSFGDVNGSIRVLVATIAFGMGVDCKGVHRTIHFGPSKNLEAYIQETGRAGRDGQQSTCHLLYNGLLLAHVEKDIKAYVSNKECRRKMLLQKFSSNANSVFITPHLCCDNCAPTCQCGCEKQPFQSLITSQKPIQPSKVRDVTAKQRKELYTQLVIYHKSLVMAFLSQHSGELKYFTNLHLLIGFSSLQINQVVEKCHMLFTIRGICDEVEIWNIEHAFKVFNLLSDIFGDVAGNVTVEEWIDDDELEDAMDYALSEWAPITDDEDFIEMFMENMSMDSTLNEPSYLGADDIPNAVLDILENLSVN